MTLPEDQWNLVERSVPILCVDVLPWFRTDEGVRAGLIRRRDEVDGDGGNLIGGRVRLVETLASAVERHMRETLGEELTWRRTDFSHPESVEQYLRHPEVGFGFDPRHHAVGLTYAVECRGSVHAAGEALGFRLFSRSGMPQVQDIGFGQGRVVHEVLRSIPEDRVTSCDL